MEHSQSENPFVLMLVHGTRFPPDPRLFTLWRLATGAWRRLRRRSDDESDDEFSWVDPGSSESFASVLGETFESARIERLLWKGWNSVKARDAGTKSLCDRISSEKGDKTIIVAHSHGGNIAMRALQQMSSQESVLGVACLGTPFLHPLPQDPYGIAWLRFWEALASLPRILRHQMVGVPVLIGLSAIAFNWFTLGWFWDSKPGGDNFMRVIFSILVAVLLACLVYWVCARIALRLIALFDWLPLTFGIRKQQELRIKTAVSLVPLYASRLKFKAISTSRLPRHQIYDDPDAQARVCEWIRELLGDSTPEGAE